MDEYFKHQILLILHEESHQKNQVEAIESGKTLGLYSQERIQKTARDILVLMWLLNPHHVESVLDGVDTSDGKTVRDFLEEWKQEIDAVDGEGVGFSLVNKTISL